ncbi:hypothetical protein D3261_19460 [Halococcus sp. IIIV-5B]|nr:hypothetical protein D3261_19460 [Halococcus sp. IIIV-5B]
MVHMAANDVSGIFNANGPGGNLTMEEFLQTCASTLNEDVTFTWVSSEFLEEEGIRPWKDLPVWIPTEKNFSQDAGKAIESGLTFRPLKETIAATYQWDRNRHESIEHAGLTKQQETDLLEKWHRRKRAIKESNF